MDKERYQRIKEILARVLAVAPESRDRIIQAEVGTDEELGMDIRDLVGFDMPDNRDPPPPEALLGTRLASYTIVGVVGEGGMGTVYLAKETGSIRRNVALKIIKAGMDTAEVIGRFEGECRALALMDHPHIAKVFGAGVTESGRPYFAMDYIEGLPITTYCRDRGLDLEQRLNLFLQVCGAVHHAHQRGVIHRDLKPSNILVADTESGPAAKVIDFGVAKATGLRLTDHTVTTQLGVMIGTPEYMSPEQAVPGERDIDLRCDVYALGVILYELLTGCLPIAREVLLRAGWLGIHEQLLETEPLAPSRRTRDKKPAEVDIQHGKSPTVAWSRRIRGDLDWVTLKALARDRERRYESIRDLAEDIRCFLSHHPVRAGPPGIAYRLRKFARRNRGVLTAATLVLVAMLAGIAGTTIGMIRANRAERAAQDLAANSEAGRLYQMARGTDVQSRRLPLLRSALAQVDDPKYRREVIQSLLSQSPMTRLAVMPDSHNPCFIDFSPDGRWLAVGWSKGGSLEVLPMAGGGPLVLKGHTGYLVGVRFLHDSSRLVTAAFDSTVRVWSMPSGNLEDTWSMRGVPWIFPLADDRTLVVGESVNGERTHWWRRPVDGGNPEFLGDTGPAVENAMSVPVPAVDPGGRFLVMPEDTLLALYDLNDIASGSRGTVGTHAIRIYGCVVSPDGEAVVSFDDGGRVKFWSRTRRGTPWRDFSVGEYSPYWGRFSDDGRELYLSCFGGIRVYDLSLPAEAKPRIFSASDGWSFGVDRHPTLPWLVSGHVGSTLAAWSLAGPRRIDFDPPGGTDGCVAFSPDGNWMVTASFDGLVAAWPLEGDRIGAPQPRGEFPGFGFWRVRIDDTSENCYLTCCNSAQGTGTVTRLPLAGGEARIWPGGSCFIELDAAGRHAAANADPTMAATVARVLDLETGVWTDLEDGYHSAETIGGFLDDGRILTLDRDRHLGIWTVAGTHTETSDRMGDALKLAPDRQTFILGDGSRRWIRGRIGRPEAEDKEVTVRLGGNVISAIADSGAVHAVLNFEDGGMGYADFDHGTCRELPLWSEASLPPAFDPKGRWLASWTDGTLTLLPLPWSSPQQDYPRDRFLVWVDSLTNLEAVDDPTQTDGYRLEGWGIPDWAHPPRY